MNKEKMDEGLRGNEKIESYIEMLRKEPSQELLAVTLTSIRRRMKEGGQFIVPVDTGSDGRLQIQAMKADNALWLPAFSSFDEELKGSGRVMSTFMADIGQIFSVALSSDTDGILLNPWNNTLRLDKGLLRIIMGESTSC